MLNRSALKNYFSKRKYDILLSAAAIALIWLLWIIAYYGVKNDYVVPSARATFKSFWHCLTSVGFWTAFLHTLLRTAVAFLISFALSVALVALSAVSKSASVFLKPFMGILRALPTLAIILILLFWTTPKIAPVIVAVLVLFPMIYSQLSAAVGEIDGEIIEMATAYGIGKRDRLTKIYLPMIAPNVLALSGTNVALGLKIIVSAEVLADTYKSLGGLMQNARFYVDMPRLAALTLIVVLIGFAIDICFSLVGKHAFKWRKKI